MIIFSLFLFLPTLFALDRIDSLAYIESCRQRTASAENQWRLKLDLSTSPYDPSSNSLIAISNQHAIALKEFVTTITEGVEVVRPTNTLTAYVTSYSGDKFKTNISHVLLAENDDKTFGKIAILQLSDPLPDFAQYLCITSAESWPSTEVFRFDTTATTSSWSGEDVFCTEELCKVPSENSCTFLQKEGAKLIGIGLNSTTAISIGHWSEFICHQTGACTEADLLVPPDSHIVTILNGQSSHIENVDSFRHELISSIAFTRLSYAENSKLKTECGQSTFFLVEVLSKVSTGKCHHEYGCQPNLMVAAKCRGVLVSRRHVITSTACLKRTSETRSSYFIEFIFSRHVTKEVGVVHLAVPWLESETDDTIALLEMEEPISGDSGPVCMPTDSRLFPEYLYAASLRHNFESESHLSKVRASWIPGCDLNCHYIEMHDTFQETAFGTPLVEFSSLYGDGIDNDDDRVTLHAVATWSRKSRGTGVLIYPFKTFICTHTGICDDSELFEEAQMFFPYDLNSFRSLDCSNMITEIHSITGSITWNHWQRAITEGRERVSKYERLIQLNDEERNDNLELCGKKFDADFLIIHIGKVEDRTFYIFNIENTPEITTTYCTGVLISKKHVLTDRLCATEHVDLSTVVFMNTPTKKNENRPRVAVHHLIHPGRQNKYSTWSGVAVLELANEIPENWYSAIVCIDDNGMEFSSMELITPSPPGEGQKRTNVDRADLKKITIWSQDAQINLLEWHASARKVGQLEKNQRGSPLIGKSVSGIAYALGFATEHEPKTTKFFALLPFIKDIGRITGVVSSSGEQQSWKVEQFSYEDHEIYKWKTNKVC